MNPESISPYNRTVLAQRLSDKVDWSHFSQLQPSTRSTQESNHPMVEISSDSDGSLHKRNFEEEKVPIPSQSVSNLLSEDIEYRVTGYHYNRRDKRRLENLMFTFEDGEGNKETHCYK